MTLVLNPYLKSSTLEIVASYVLKSASRDAQAAYQKALN